MSGPWRARATSEGFQGFLSAGASGMYTRRTASCVKGYTDQPPNGNTFLFIFHFAPELFGYLRATSKSYRFAPQIRVYTGFHLFDSSPGRVLVIMPRFRVGMSSPGPVNAKPEEPLPVFPPPKICSPLRLPVTLSLWS
jgi:hypothetical protein